MKKEVHWLARSRWQFLSKLIDPLINIRINYEKILSGMLPVDEVELEMMCEK
jgi:hypothetical protein